MVNLLDEIKEDIDNEKWRNLFNKYLPHIFFSSLFLIIIVSVFAFLQNSKTKKQEEVGELFNTISSTLNKTNYSAKSVNALNDFIALKHNNIYSVFAKFTKAEIESKNKHFKEALNIYKNIAEDKKIDQNFRQLSAFLALTEAISMQEEKIDLQKRIEKIKDLEGPYTDLIKFQIALWHFMNNENIKAKEILSELKKADKIPEFLKNQINIVLEVAKRNDNMLLINKD